MSAKKQSGYARQRRANAKKGVSKQLATRTRETGRLVGDPTSKTPRQAANRANRKAVQVSAKKPGASARTQSAAARARRKSK